VATTLEQILSCPTLPTLPAVALAVIEQTADPDIKLDQLAKIIERDQALAAKVLRTVNSSFYGLRQRCTTIQKALVMLGLSPVKCLALGFSLVASLEHEKEPKFDFISYWRRGLYGAVGARLVAEAAGHENPDEAFLAALLQDIGMVAMYRALGDEYLRVIAETKGDHRKLVRLELETFDLQHPEIGAMLGARWRLPESITLPVKYHERPTAAPLGCSLTTRCVGVGGLIHDALTETRSAAPRRRMFERCSGWFRIESDQANQLLRRAAESVEEFAKLFSLDVEGGTDPDAVMAEADRRLVDLARAGREASFVQQTVMKELGDEADCDPLTGAIGLRGYRGLLARSFDKAMDAGAPLSLVQIALEGLQAAEAGYGPAGRDEVLLGATALMHKYFEPLGGAVCRLGQSVFAVVLPGCDGDDAQVACEELRRQLPANARTWAPPTAVEAIVISASIGLATFYPTREGFGRAEELAVAAARAAQMARSEGGDRVRAHQEQREAA